MIIVDMDEKRRLEAELEAHLKTIQDNRERTRVIMAQFNKLSAAIGKNTEAKVCFFNGPTSIHD